MSSIHVIPCKSVVRKELKEEDFLQDVYSASASLSFKLPGDPGIGISQVFCYLWKNELSTAHKLLVYSLDAESHSLSAQPLTLTLANPFLGRDNPLTRLHFLLHCTSGG